MAAPGAVMVSSTEDSGLRTNLDGAASSDTEERKSGALRVIENVGFVTKATTLVEAGLDVCTPVDGETKAFTLLLESARHIAKAKLEIRNMIQSTSQFGVVSL